MKHQQIDKETVKRLDLHRYMGRWYEIARFNHRFEKGMDRVMAEYMIRSDGKIDVVNSGYRQEKFRSTHGKAKQPDPADPGKLKVSFFLFFYSDYYILELDEKEYSYALVGSSSDKYLWILSRTPHLPSETMTLLLTKASLRGYDTRQLIFVKQ